MNQRRQERNWSLTRNILRNQREHRRACLLRPFSTLLHLFQEFHCFCTRFFCQIQENLWVKAVTCTISTPCPSRLLSISATLPGIEAIASHSCLCLVRSRYFSNSPLFCLGKASSYFFNSSFFQGLSSMFCTLSSHCQCCAHPFLFVPQRSNSLASSSPFFKIRAPPLHAVGIEILCKSPALPSALLVI